MRYLVTQDEHRDSRAVEMCLETLRDAVSHIPERSVTLWREVKQIILFALRDHEGVPLSPRLNIKEGEVLLIFPDAVTGDLSCHDFTEDVGQN